MDFIHVKNLEKYHPGYRDRKLIWAKIHFDIITVDPDFLLIENEADKWRFIGIVMLELQNQKPLPNDERFWRKYFDTKKRPMSLTLLMLQKFLELDTEVEQVPCIEKRREEKRREEKSGAPEWMEVQELWKSKKYPLGEAEKFFSFYSSNGWRVGKNPMKNWRAAASGWVLRSYEFSKGKNSPARELPKADAKRKLCEWGCGQMLTDQQIVSHPDTCPNFKRARPETMKSVNEAITKLSISMKSPV